MATGTLELEVRAIVIADPTILTGDLGFDTATGASNLSVTLEIERLL